MKNSKVFYFLEFDLVAPLLTWSESAPTFNCATIDTFPDTHFIMT